MSSDTAARASKAKETSQSSALSEPSLFSKALRPTAHPEWHKDEALDVFWWLKQVAAVVVGVALGSVGVTGWVGFAAFAVVQYLVANVWAQHARLVGVCVEPFEVFTENAFVAAGTFVVLWTLIYSVKVSLGLL
ncbi:conserved hypothetical protein [Neospora caninum Liverpool]|uniref:Rab5-interacting protein n=1 Tax=Neospora caninum (strain Liverpool) TaxID=572307 RepID=F0V8N2_NEOCL|nr:conserved hypothetical protein [Neospora caninum Liverpool]CBZ50073.1 conserved hypothetical protein [Neospora caninum Liverpool]CEL64667.1 TPA: hypothetical protein BN1204_005490 [Neospora caninum Liverpool]|eukprot:XP_003880108.1 conserved hypothetical protein [Neospora caninum Liverpool]